MTDTMLEIIGKIFPLTEEPCGEFSQMKVSGMTFHIRRFAAEGLGSVSVMKAAGFFGLMKMDTLIITASQKDMPLLSYDRVHALGNDTLIFELYDTTVGSADLTALDQVVQEAAYLPDHDLGAHWYDSIKLPQSISKKARGSRASGFDATAVHYLAKYLETAKTAEACDPAAKREKDKVYVEGLLANGGPSTDLFRKHQGEEKTAELFRSILFGTGN